MYTKRYNLLLIFIVIILACEKDNEWPVDNGEADFTTYIAVGNSFTAGFTNNGLYREAQLVSFPNLLAKQFKRAGGGEFAQPLFHESQANGTGYLKLKKIDPHIIEKETSQLAIIGIGADGKTPLLSKYESKISNLGIPGLKISDIKTAGYGANNPFGFNPFFERLLSLEQQNKTYLQVVNESNPTFFTCWLGNNDVLDYALSGGMVTTTSYEFFSGNCRDLFQTLTAKGAKGVVANIVDFTFLPYFTTVTVASLKANASGAPIYIRTGADVVREATNQDLILLNADSIGVVKDNLAKGFTPKYPLNNEDVLDIEEVNFALSRVTGYNELIQQAALFYNIPVLNTKELLMKVNDGISENGVMVNSTYIIGGAYSLDGVHLTPRGNAILANEFIKRINSFYHSKLPLLNISKYDEVRISD